MSRGEREDAAAAGFTSPSQPAAATSPLVMGGKADSSKPRGRSTKKRRRKKLTTAKFALGYIFGSCTVVQLYSMIAMWHFADLSALYALIGATVGEAISYCAYTAKSAKENTKGGVVYETAMREQEIQINGAQG